MTASWRGSVALKARVLEVLESHRARAALAPFELDGETFELHGWSAPANFAAMAHAFGIPRMVLELGWYLFDGFPEDAASIRAAIAERARVLAAIPVGRDLDGVATDLMFWLLTDAEAGLRAMIGAPELAALIDAAALALVEPDAAIGDRLEAARAIWSAELPRQWQRDGRVDPEVYRNARVLDVAIGALAGRPVGAIGCLTTGVFGVGDRAPLLEPIAAKFLALVGGSTDQ